MLLIWNHSITYLSNEMIGWNFCYNLFSGWSEKLSSAYLTHSFESLLKAIRSIMKVWIFKMSPLRKYFWWWKLVQVAEWMSWCWSRTPMFWTPGSPAPSTRLPSGAGRKIRRTYKSKRSNSRDSLGNPAPVPVSTVSFLHYSSGSSTYRRYLAIFAKP